MDTTPEAIILQIRLSKLIVKGKSSYLDYNIIVFPFSFDIPTDSPSSYSFQNIARLQYLITG
jgi:hypothetical protein